MGVSLQGSAALCSHSLVVSSLEVHLDVIVFGLLEVFICLSPVEVSTLGVVSSLGSLPGMWGGGSSLVVVSSTGEVSSLRFGPGPLWLEVSTASSNWVAPFLFLLWIICSAEGLGVHLLSFQ